MTFNKKQEILSKKAQNIMKRTENAKFWPKKQELLLFPENSPACLSITFMYHFEVLFIKGGWTSITPSPTFLYH